jgi:DNA-binding transcriptional ArsR family regulator
MGYEYLPDDTADHTTEAIEDILTTLYGETGDEIGDPDAGPIVPDMSDGRSAEDFDNNQGLEDELVRANIFKTRGGLQRQALGCLGCQLAGATGDWRGIRPKKIAECTGGSLGGVRRIIGQLKEADLVETRYFDGRGSRGPQPEWFAPTAEWAAFSKPPEAPPVCGPEARQQEPNLAAEQLLLEKGVIRAKGSYLPRAILGCLACRLQTGETGAYGRGISECKDMSQSSVSTALRSLHEAGALDASEEYGPDDKGGRTRLVYRPADNELGKALAEIIRAPRTCGFEAKQHNEKGPTA